MFSPTAGPSSSRTSPSDRKWLPRTSSLADAQALARHHARVRGPGADHAPASATAAICTARIAPARAAAARAAGRACGARGRRNGGSSGVGIERSTVGTRASSGGGSRTRQAAARVMPAHASCRSSSPAVHTLPGAEGQHDVALADLRRQPLAGRAQVARRTRRPPVAARRRSPRASASELTPGIALLARRDRCPRAAARRRGGRRGRSRPRGAGCACSGAAGRARRCAARPRGARSVSRVARISVGWWP